jgi:hypothetical protein
VKREGTGLSDPEAVLPGVGVRSLLAWAKRPLYCWIESAVETSTGPAGQTPRSSSRWEFHDDDALDRVPWLLRPLNPCGHFILRLFVAWLLDGESRP